jgi:hypothetical protein
VRNPIHEKGFALVGRPQWGSATANVQAFVELLIQFLLLGIEYRLLLLFRLDSWRARRKLLRAGLQMADRRVTGYRGRGTCEWFGIADSIAQNEGAA